MRLCDIGEAIQEVMESYEVELEGKTYQGGYFLIQKIYICFQRKKYVTFHVKLKCSFDSKNH